MSSSGSSETGSQRETRRNIHNNTAAWVSQARGNSKKKKPLRDSSSEDSTYCASISNYADESVPYRQARTYVRNVDYENIPIQPQSPMYPDDVQSSMIIQNPRGDVLNPLGARQPATNPLAHRESASRENTPAIRNMTFRNPFPIASPISVPPGNVYVPHNMYQFPPKPGFTPNPISCVPVPSHAHVPYIPLPNDQVPLSYPEVPSYNMLLSQVTPYNLPLHVPTYNNVIPPNVASSFQNAPPQVIPPKSNETVSFIPPSKHNRTNHIQPENHCARKFITEIKLSYDYSAKEVPDVVNAVQETSLSKEQSIDSSPLPQRQNKTTEKMLPGKDETKPLDCKKHEDKTEDQETSPEVTHPMDNESQSEVTYTTDSKITTPKSAEKHKYKNVERQFYIAPGYRKNQDEKKSESSEVPISEAEKIKSRRNSVHKSEIGSRKNSLSNSEVSIKEDESIVNVKNTDQKLEHSDSSKNKSTEFKDVELIKTRDENNCSNPGKGKNKKNVKKSNNKNIIDAQTKKEKSEGLKNKKDCVNKNNEESQVEVIKTESSKQNMHSAETSKIPQNLKTEQEAKSCSLINSVKIPSHFVLENNRTKARCVSKDKPPFKNPSKKVSLTEKGQNNTKKVKHEIAANGDSNHKNKHTHQTNNDPNLSNFNVQEGNQDAVIEYQVSTEEHNRKPFNPHKFPCNNSSYTTDQVSSNNYSHVQDSIQDVHHMKKEKPKVSNLPITDKQYEHNFTNKHDRRLTSQEIKGEEKYEPPTHSYRLARFNRKVRGNYRNVAVSSNFEKALVLPKSLPGCYTESTNFEFTINAVKSDVQKSESKLPCIEDTTSSIDSNTEFGKNLIPLTEILTTIEEKITSESVSEGHSSDFIDPACGIMHHFKKSEKHNPSQLPSVLLPIRNETISNSSFNDFLKIFKTENHSKKVELSKASQMKEPSLAQNLLTCVSDNQNNCVQQDNNSRLPEFNSLPSNLRARSHNNVAVKLMSKVGIPPGFENVSSESNIQLKQFSFAEQIEQEMMKTSQKCIPPSTEVIFTKQIDEECHPNYNLPNSLVSQKSLSSEFSFEKQMDCLPEFEMAECKKLPLKSQFVHDVKSHEKQSGSDSSSIKSDPPESSNKQQKSTFTNELQRRVYLASMKKEERIKYLFNSAASNTSQSSEAGSSEYEEVVDYWDGSVVKELKPTQRSKPPVSVEKRSVFFEEIEGNLFHSPPTSSLVHCVAEDMQMGQGIAIEFRRRFHRVGELLNQYSKSGELAVLTDSNRFIYYLVTKNLSPSKPLMCNLEKSVLQLKEHCLRHNVTHLCMPLIGCGRDQLSWPQVKKFLIETFSGTGIRISVYKIDKELLKTSKKRRAESSLHASNKRFKLDVAKYKPLQTCDSEVWEDESATNYMTHRDELNKCLVDMESGTARVFLVYETLYPDNTMQDLNNKFKFMDDFKSNSTLSKGDVYRYVSKYPKEILYGLVVRDKLGRIDFQALETAFKSLSKKLYSDKYNYLALEAIYDENDLTIMEKIHTLMKWTIGRNCKNSVLVSICYPTHILMLQGKYGAT